MILWSMLQQEVGLYSPNSAAPIFLGTKVMKV